MDFSCYNYAAVSMLAEPYFRYNRYRYSINEECIDIREGYLFVKRNIVPIERLHKLEISKGPIDQGFFHVAKVTVTTAGGDVTLRFLEEEKAEKIAENVQKRINEIVKERGKKMENKIRFRNHISVILEQLGATFGILFVLSFTNIDDVIDYIEKGSSEELSLTVYIGGGVILAVFLLIFLYQVDHIGRRLTFRSVTTVS